MEPWGDFPDLMIKLSFLDVGWGRAVGGMTHEKTAPFVILAQAISGAYEITSPQGTITTTNGEVFLTASNTPLKIIHNSDTPDSFMTFRFIHLKFTLFETIDVFSIYSLPLKTDRETGLQIGSIIQELLD